MSNALLRSMKIPNVNLLSSKIHKVDLQAVEQHAQYCEMSENQIIFHKGYYSLEGI